MFFSKAQKVKTIFNNINSAFSIKQIRSINSNIEILRKTRHFPPHSKEWINGGYSFNKNILKNLNNNSKLTKKILKGYFNLKLFEKWWQSRRIKARFRKKSLKSILLGKPVIKLTNDKALITIYVFNNEKRILRKKILENKSQKGILKWIYSKKYRTSWKGKGVYFRLSRFFKLKNSYSKIALYRNRFYFKYLVYIFSLFNIKVYIEEKKRVSRYDFSQNRRKKFIYLDNKIHFKYDDLMDIRSRYDHYPKYIIDLNPIYKNFSKMKTNGKYRVLNIILTQFLESTFINKDLLKDIAINEDYFQYKIDLEKYSKETFFFTTFRFFTQQYFYDYMSEKLNWNYYKSKELYLKRIREFYINRAKFNQLLPGLKTILYKIYGKKINLNIINIKHPQYNLDISMQILAHKLKTKNANLKWIMKKFLARIKIHKPNKILNAKLAKLNSLNKTYLYQSCKINLPLTIFKKENARSKFFSLLLNKLYPSIKINIESAKKVNLNKFKSRKKDTKNFIIKTDKVKNILTNIRYKWLTGIRIRLSGRLTKRYTASRSVSKFKYKGNLKDLKARGHFFPSLLVRNSIKSNIEYGNFGSKRRIGSFGIKGWINAA